MIKFKFLIGVLFFFLHLPTSHAAELIGPDTRYTINQVTEFFRNSSNPFVRTHAGAFANVAVNAESGGYTALYNGICCVGLMQMSEKNIRLRSGMTLRQYALLSGQKQIDIWVRHYTFLEDYLSIVTLKQLLQNDGYVGTYKVSAEMVASCMNLGVDNCQKSINNNCIGVSPSEGGDGIVNICTHAAIARGELPNPHLAQKLSHLFNRNPPSFDTPPRYNNINQGATNAGIPAMAGAGSRRPESTGDHPKINEYTQFSDAIDREYNKIDSYYDRSERSYQDFDRYRAFP